MKHLFSLTLLFACLTLAFSGCDKAEVVEPTAAEEPVELTPEEQAEYDRQMAEQMGIVFFLIIAFRFSGLERLMLPSVVSCHFPIVFVFLPNGELFYVESF